MAASETSPATRLKALEAARIRAKKELGRGETLTSRPMAALLGVSWNTLRKWTQEIDGFAQSGAFEIGGQGVDYVFKPMKTIDWLVAHFKRERQKRNKKILTNARLSNIKAVIKEQDIHEIEDPVKILRTQSLVRERQVEDGELAPSEKYRAQNAKMIEAMNMAFSGCLQRVDPNSQFNMHETMIAKAVIEDIHASIWQNVYNVLKRDDPELAKLI